MWNEGLIYVFDLCSHVSTGTCGGSERPGDIKDVLDIEKLQLNDKKNKASKAQVCTVRVPPVCMHTTNKVTCDHV